MNYHLFIDRNLYNFCSVFLKKHTGGEYFFLDANFLYGNFSVKKTQNNYIFPPYTNLTMELEHLEKQIKNIQNTKGTTTIWINTNDLKQETIFIELVDLIKDRIFMVIDLASSRPEKPSESTDKYYLSLYKNRQVLSPDEIKNYTSLKHHLYQEKGDIRVKYNDVLINVPFDYFDKIIIDTLSIKRKVVKKFLPEIIIKIYSSGYVLPSDYLIIARLLELSNGNVVNIRIPSLNKYNLLNIWFSL